MDGTTCFVFTITISPKQIMILITRSKSAYPILPELQKRADREDQSVLFFLAGANFWEKHAKNC